ncbi:MAG: hypothetical protein O7F75_10640 [Alphaproteobacteria bacterium]|nr:hypothetical protein [Alphaproteobacteria bacterium]MCZ6849292.1 hypothetical protein [Alphaproteobacteria bacterium]
MEPKGTGMDENGKKYWLDKPGSVTLVYRAVWVVCGLLAVADFFYAQHPVFEFESFPVFYGLFGFIVCVGLVLGAKELRKILKRAEDYYDR